MRPRSGIALIVALLALIALAGAVTASFFPAREGERIGERAARLELLASGAELGLSSGLQSITPGLLAAHPEPGIILQRDTALAAAGQRIEVRILATRVPGGAAWLASRAAFPHGGERRARHLVLREQRPSFPSAHAIIARIAPDQSPDFVISGADEAPPGWSDCDAARPPEAALLLSPLDDSYRRFGGDSLPSLMARAAAPTPGVVGGPIVVLPPGGSLGPGSGSGVVIAPGPLRLVGPLDFAGVVIALDSLATGPNVQLHGVLLAAGDAPVRLQGPGAVRRSECAVRRAERALARMVAGPWSWGISY
ncbi:MAG: hypothetical protein ACYC3Q_09815 [Gemmatimonadaceae bacterium]